MITATLSIARMKMLPSADWAAFAVGALQARVELAADLARKGLADQALAEVADAAMFSELYDKTWEDRIAEITGSAS